MSWFSNLDCSKTKTMKHNYVSIVTNTGFNVFCWIFLIYFLCWTIFGELQRPFLNSKWKCENSIKCNWKSFKHSIHQICCRKSSYARILYFVYSQLIFWFRLCQLQVMHYRKLFWLYWGKWKLHIVQYLNCSNYVSFSPWDWHQIGNKACCILKVSKFYIE